jgi:hypothetical protein
VVNLTILFFVPLLGLGSYVIDLGDGIIGASKDDWRFGSLVVVDIMYVTSRGLCVDIFSFAFFTSSWFVDYEAMEPRVNNDLYF